MKVVLPSLIALVALARSSFGQAAPPLLEGFLGVPFGADQETVKKQFPGNAHTRLNRVKSKDNRLWFDGGKFAGFKAEHYVLEFAANRLWMVELHLQAVSKDHEKEFGTLKQMLTEKYGEGKDEPGEALSTAWYVAGAGNSPNTIRINADPKGVGVIVWYLSDAVRLSAPAKTVAPQKPQPIKTNPTAKDDL